MTRRAARTRARRVPVSTASPPRSGRDGFARHALPLILSLAAVSKAVVLARLHDHPLLQPVGGTDSAYYMSLAHGVLGARSRLGGARLLRRAAVRLFPGRRGRGAPVRARRPSAADRARHGGGVADPPDRARLVRRARRAAGRGSCGGDRAVHVPRDPAAARRARPVPDGAGPVRGRARGDRA